MAKTFRDSRRRIALILGIMLSLIVAAPASADGARGTRGVEWTMAASLHGVEWTLVQNSVGVLVWRVQGTDGRGVEWTLTAAGPGGVEWTAVASD